MRTPPADGLKVTWKVVLPEGAIGEVAMVVTAKSAASAPPTVIVPAVRGAFPRFPIVKVRTTVPPRTSVPPKSVWSTRVGVVSPSGISASRYCRLPRFLEPSRYREILKLKGFSSLSFVTKLTVAVRSPEADGSNVTTKVLLWPAGTEVGAPETTKSVPAVNGPTVRLAVPEFVIVKVRANVPPVTAVAPKSVWSVPSGRAVTVGDADAIAR